MKKDKWAHLRTPAVRRKAAAAAAATHARKKAEAAALASFAGKIQQAPYPASAEPTLRVSQMAEFVVALVDAARRSK